jgi:hypothetical protein
MTFNFFFDVIGFAIYELVFGVEQVAEGFWFLRLLFCEFGVVYYLCECCFVSFCKQLALLWGEFYKELDSIPPKLLHVSFLNCLQMN